MDERERRRRLIGGIGAVVVGLVVAFVPLLQPAEAAVVAKRVSGADRYATAAAVSADAFSPGVGTAYVATGTAFPDALAGAVAAAKAGGPVLLTQRDALPASTATELDRLNPGKIVVLGGTGAVSQAVLNALDPYTDGTVTRIDGADRYATAANLSAATFTTTPINTVFVATGLDFPDALAGGPAAANAPGSGGPILLVQQGSIPQATKAELTRLAAQQVIVLGGTQAVSDAVKTELEDYSTAPVLRISGADRYITAVAISSATFSANGPSKVYLATGRNFPDALAGGPPAGIADGPVLLTQPDCIPPEVNAEITRLDPDSLIVLGGTGVVSDAVLARTECNPAASSTSTSFPFSVPSNFPTSLPPGWTLPGGGSVPSFPTSP